MLNYITIIIHKIIYNIWSGKYFLYLILLPLSWIYKLFFKIRFLAYSYGFFKKYKFSIPILIVGNITCGGNGKTPLVLWLIKQLKINKWKVGVVTRGYKGKYNNYPLIINDKTNVYQCGDEALLIWKRTKVPVIVSPKRIKAIPILIKKNLDIIISDDGLQHYSLERDLEWIVIDGKERFGNGCCIPAGPLRENISRLKNVDQIIINNYFNNKKKELTMYLKPKLAINLLTGKKSCIKKLKSVIAIAGIGFPNRFFETIKILGLTPKKKIIFPNHKNYNKKMLKSLTKFGENLLMTEKDAIKCYKFADISWWYLPVEATFKKKDSKKLILSIENIIKKYKK
ncbi:tetraacyldisaccharide 4'-kinase [Sodalis-like secondary symbiont of Drepanosiphum platanoidis]|uniref:tetraacyldisaccharide 4'-kinase n=1 Tax=Sodalis-like secondary symbiont of Drepanosiphum platanoidis TaxID=2994493 RepID=UPI003463D02C